MHTPEDKLSISGRFQIPENIITTEVDVSDSVVSSFIVYAGSAAFLLWAYIGISILTLPRHMSYLT